MNETEKDIEMRKLRVVIFAAMDGLRGEDLTASSSEYRRERVKLHVTKTAKLVSAEALIYQAVDRIMTCLSW